jgi:hypothetical protein
MSKTPEYQAWRGIISRTTNKDSNRAYRYLDRGITVCDSWLSSFENFYKDMGDRPSPKHSIDRVDNDGNYEPSNCRWATRIEQANNTSKNINMTINGETKTPQQWSDITGVSRSTIYHRLERGCTPSEAIIRKNKKKRESADALVGE